VVSGYVGGSVVADGLVVGVAAPLALEAGSAGWHLSRGWYDNAAAAPLSPTVAGGQTLQAVRGTMYRRPTHHAAPHAGPAPDTITSSKFACWALLLQTGPNHDKASGRVAGGFSLSRLLDE
jgi:hypothetical protein